MCIYRFLFVIASASICFYWIISEIIKIHRRTQIKLMVFCARNSHHQMDIPNELQKHIFYSLHIQWIKHNAIYIYTNIDFKNRYISLIMFRWKMGHPKIWVGRTINFRVSEPSCVSVIYIYDRFSLRNLRFSVCGP